LYAGYGLPANYTEGLFSTACLITGTHVQKPLISLCAGVVENIVIRLNTDLSITALRNATVLGSSAAGVIPISKRFRIEIGFVISDTVGEVKVNIDQGSGASKVINLTSQDTRDAADLTGIVNRFRVYNQNPAITYWDDIWLDDDKTAFRVDQTFARLAPSADVSGVSTPSTGSDRYAMIDEVPASTTDYVTFAVTGEDVYECADLSTTPTTITGVGILYIASKTDSGTLEFRSRVLSNADYANGTTTGLNMSTLGYSDFYATDPQGGGAWTKARIDAARLVLERIS
jgi:hypothetical protein